MTTTRSTEASQIKHREGRPKTAEQADEEMFVHSISMSESSNCLERTSCVVLKLQTKQVLFHISQEIVGVKHLVQCIVNWQVTMNSNDIW